MAVNLETTTTTCPSCPICGSAPSHYAFEKNGYQHYSCSRCGLLFVHPLPSQEELVKFYDRENEQNSQLCWEGTREHMVPVWDGVLRFIESRCGRGPLLDVGCGGGQFLAHARRKGWTDLTGLEVSPVAAGVARTNSQAVIHERTLTDAPLAPGAFSAITIWDVIEHLSDAREAVRRARQLLRPGGAIVISTVNRGGVSLRLLGRKFFAVAPPEHLTYYTKKTMATLLRSEGFRVGQLVTRDVYIRDWIRLLNRGGAQAADEQYKAGYQSLTGSRLLKGAMAAANVLLDFSSLGDELIATGLADTQGGRP